MKILVLVLLLSFAENSSLDDSNDHKILKREFGVQYADNIAFVQAIFFNSVGKLLPQGWFLNAILNLLKSAQSKPSLIDQVSISPTFYARLFCTNVVCEVFLYLHFRLDLLSAHIKCW